MNINMRILSRTLFHKSAKDFNTIIGYDDVKNIIRQTLGSEESFNLLLWGEPAGSKTLFLLELAKQKGAIFFDCTNTISRRVGTGAAEDYIVRRFR